MSHRRISFLFCKTTCPKHFILRFLSFPKMNSVNELDTKIDWKRKHEKELSLFSNCLFSFCLKHKEALVVMIVVDSVYPYLAILSYFLINSLVPIPKGDASFSRESSALDTLCKSVLLFSFNQIKLCNFYKGATICYLDYFGNSITSCIIGYNWFFLKGLGY